MLSFGTIKVKQKRCSIFDIRKVIYLLVATGFAEIILVMLAFACIGTDNNMDNINETDSSRVHKAIYSSEVNLLWMPFSNGLVRLECSKALRRVKNGDEGKMDMITLPVRYDSQRQ